jgi:hypothetical protein
MNWNCYAAILLEHILYMVCCDPSPLPPSHPQKHSAATNMFDVYTSPSPPPPLPPTTCVSCPPPPPFHNPQVRNERALEALRDELEELEEQLTDSISASIQGKKVRHSSATSFPACMCVLPCPQRPACTQSTCLVKPCNHHLPAPLSFLW